MKDYRILIKYATRGRPDKFFNVLEQYINMAHNLSSLAFLVSIDEDDSTMNNSIIYNKLNSYKNRVKLIYFVGNSKTKIQAINADVNRVSGWDILLVAADDAIPVMQGYDNIIRKDMNDFYRNTDGVLWYHDGAQDRINTMCVLGKKYYERFNYIYNPEYISLWCDNEFTDISLQLNRVYKSDKVIIEHQHPAWAKSNFDELYIRNESFFQIDQKTYEKRKQRNFDLENSQPLLSILTPSVPERMDSCLKKLMSKVNSQIGNLNVEHLVFLDNRKRSIGLKRDTLVKMAKGKYMAFVDDDDDISEDYVSSLVEAINDSQGVDVITFKQKCLVNDNEPSTIIFSLKHSTNEDYFPGGDIKRIPFHMCAWKSELAQNYNFNDSNYGEDWFWIEQLIKVAKTEYHIDKILHTYIYSDSTTTTPQPV